MSDVDKNLDDYVSGSSKEPENEGKRKNSGSTWLIVVWIISEILFIGSVPIECSYSWTIAFGFICLALFVPAVYFGFAPKNICFTIISEGTAKVVTTGGAAVDVLLQYKDHAIDADYNISDSKGAVQPSLFSLGGLRFYGIWPFRQIYNYKFSWASIDQDGEKKEHKDELLDYVMIKDTLYWFNVKEAEDKDLLPLNLEGLVTVRVVNPYKALFSAQNWLKIVVALIQTLLRGEVAESVYEDLVAGKKMLGKKIKEDPDATPLWDNLKNNYGVEVITVEVKDIDPPEKFRELTMKRLIAQREKIAIIIGAEAEAERMNKVYSEIEARGDVGRLVRTLEMLEKSKDKWVISPDILEAVRGLFGGKKSP